MTSPSTTAAESTDVVSWDGVTIPEHVRNRTSVALAVGGSLRAYLPQHPGCYLRTSRDRQGDEKSIGLQLKDAEARRIALGWVPFAEVYRENDTSAFKKKRTVRADGSTDWAVDPPRVPAHTRRPSVGADRRSRLLRHRPAGSPAKRSRRPDRCHRVHEATCGRGHGRPQSHLRRRQAHGTNAVRHGAQVVTGHITTCRPKPSGRRAGR
jgi:hypothetical protein